MLFIFPTVYDTKDKICRPKWPKKKEHDPHCPQCFIPWGWYLLAKATLVSAHPAGRWRSECADSSNTFPLSTENQHRAFETLICKSLPGCASVFFSKQLAITSVYSVSRTQADRHWQSIIITTKEWKLLSSRGREISRTPTCRLTHFPDLWFIFFK